jgi:uncharacterized protein (TIGR02757 family)
MVTGVVGQDRSSGRLAEALEGIYKRYNRRELIASDPLEFVYRYDGGANREVAGLIASSLAFGNVKQIRRSVERALEPLGREPAELLRETTRAWLDSAYGDFQHRWIRGGDLASFLWLLRDVIREHGSLRELFYAKLDDRDEDVAAALARLVDDLRSRSADFPARLLPSPAQGSACKRLHLFLRWMARRDDVDPGGWSEISPAMLIVPLDTHMFGICGALRFTERAQADLKAAREATSRFRELSPGDPVKFDFSLTHLGMLGIEREPALAGALALACARRASPSRRSGMRHAAASSSEG